jgi:hypothetical protein
MNIVDHTKIETMIYKLTFECRNDIMPFLNIIHKRSKKFKVEESQVEFESDFSLQEITAILESIDASDVEYEIKKATRIKTRQAAFSICL